MTYDEFLDNCKKRGYIIYICSCGFRGMGTAVTYHPLNCSGHITKEVE